MQKITLTITQYGKTPIVFQYLWLYFDLWLAYTAVMRGVLTLFQIDYITHLKSVIPSLHTTNRSNYDNTCILNLNMNLNAYFTIFLSKIDRQIEFQSMTSVQNGITQKHRNKYVATEV